MQLFNHVYQNETVLVTGHTGFKGAWLTAWLLELGATVVGYSLAEPPTDPSLFELARLGSQITDIRGDIRDYERVLDVVREFRPKIIFHMAAQPIVLHGIRDPKPTFDINAGGTVNLLEAVRQTDCVSAVVCITTDKVYENREWLFGYREIDRLGGHDPYSASKAMAELAISSYRDSFFPPERYAEHGVAVASARAGNVIGGGDFADYRLVPDCVKSLLDDAPIAIRNPNYIRPWQHVLVPLSGYLWLGAKLIEDGAAYAEAWNFAPIEQKGITVGQIAEKLVELWGSGSWFQSDPNLPKVETGQLRLSWDKAATRLDWHPVWDWQAALGEIVAFTQAFSQEADMHTTIKQHISQYVLAAQQQTVGWVQPSSEAC
ncbi:MAG: CDP-glucose 4,6-dehydratase [Candidatus Promineifilaceae bacterium]